MIHPVFRFVACLLLASPVFAADRWYEIEVIVFKLTDPALGAENWPALPPEPVVETAVPAPNTIALPVLSGAGISSSARDLLRVASVPKENYKLAGAYKSLTRSRLYTPVLHTAWRQPVGNGKVPFTVRLAGGTDFSGDYGIDGQRLDTGSPPALGGLFEIDGVVSFQSKNLLYANLDLIHRRKEIVPLAAPAAITPSGENVPPVQPAAAPEKAAPEEKVQFYSLSQHRRVKSGEVQYFDHPVFGVLLEMRPLEPGAEASTESGAEFDAALE